MPIDCKAVQSRLATQYYKFVEPFEVTTPFSRRFNMRAIKMFMLSTAANLLLAA
jgi:hypothetical protein